MGERMAVSLMQAVAGRVLLTLAGPAPAGVAAAALSIATGASARSPVLRVLFAEGGTTLVLDLDPLATLPLFDAPLALALVGAGGETLAEGEARLTPVGIDAGGIAPEHRAGIERVIDARVFTPTVAAALRWKIAPTPASAAPDAHLEFGVPMGGGAAVGGWIANLGDRPLLLLSDGLESVRRSSGVAVFERRDITDRIAADGGVATTDRHGFATTLPLFRPGDRGFLVFEEKGTEVEFLARLSWDGAQRGTAEEALGAVVRRFGDGEYLAPGQAHTHLAPLLGRASAAEPRADTIELKEGGPEPALSVVIPLYGQPFLLRGLAQNQPAFPPDTEFVLVSDDPELHGFARDYLLDRRPLLARPTRLLLNHGNYGFSVANNLGVRDARSRVILFQNSDVRVEDASGIEHALEAVRDGRFGVVGFRLLFEDGTVQHDGMRFERHRHLHDLHTAEHPGKGLPPGVAGEVDVAPVEAVTGAMMMIARDWFDTLGGFDPGYVRGDFEDGDLCLRSVEAGRPVGIARGGRIRHLERQSIMDSGGGVARAAITYLNCLRFNERWGARLGAAV